MKKITQEDIMKVLDTAYEKAVVGIPGFDSAQQMGDNYRSRFSSREEAIDSLVNWQIGKCATSGFLTGLGGIITLPVAIPANITSVIYIQVRMIAAIAHICDYDLKDDTVKTLVYMCLCGNSANEIAKTAGIKIGTQISKTMIKKIPGTVLNKINQKVGFRLLTKFGQKGVINLGKMIPLAGGIIGGTFDAASTKVIAKVSKKTFLSA